MNRSTQIFAVSTLAAALAACGGSGGGSSTGSTGSVSVGLTDAPVHSLTRVDITFTAIRLKPEEGDWIDFTFDEAKSLNLLDLQGGVTEPLLTDEEVAAGPYSEIRLIIDNDSSTVTDDNGGQFSLAVPSGEQSGLKLKGDFEVTADASTSYTIDFDVRKSIVDPQGQALGNYMLKPVLRLVANDNVGTIEGEVDYAQISAVRLSDDGLADCAANYEGSAYVYEGADVEPVDLNVSRDESAANPLMVLPVTAQESGSLYDWVAAFLPAGDYTVSYSCQLDDNEVDNNLEFDGTQNVTVMAGETTTAELITLQP